VFSIWIKSGYGSSPLMGRPWPGSDPAWGAAGGVSGEIAVGLGDGSGLGEASGDGDDSGDGDGLGPGRAAWLEAHAARKMTERTATFSFDVDMALLEPLWWCARLPRLPCRTAFV
jgi:hypothetical protein